MTKTVALVDGGSFVLPYDFHVVEALSEAGFEVHYRGSRSAFNGNFLEAMDHLPNVGTVVGDISSSVARGRVAALLAYLRLLLRLCREARRFDVIAYQFAPAWPFDLIAVALLRRKVAFVVHDAVPHDSGKTRYWPYGMMSRLARQTWFVSEATEKAFRRGWQIPDARSRVVAHGRIALAPGIGQRRFDVPASFEALAFWGTVKPYKGVDRLLELGGAAANGLPPLEIHGRWDRDLDPLKSEFLDRSVLVADKYLDDTEIASLFRRDVLFLLPYRAASQSGVLYTLLHHGCVFLAADVGDFAVFLRQHGLGDLLVEDFAPETLRRKIAWLVAERAQVNERLQQAADHLGWEPFVAAVRDFPSGAAEAPASGVRRGRSLPSDP